jgi:hypothetical protein
LAVGVLGRPSDAEDAMLTALGRIQDLRAVMEEFGPSSQADPGRRLRMDRRSVSEEAAELQRGKM